MRDGLVRKVKVEQRFAGGERVGLVDVWGEHARQRERPVQRPWGRESWCFAGVARRP